MRQVNAAILKSAGYEIQESTTRSADGTNKIDAKFGGEIGVPGFIKLQSEIASSLTGKNSSGTTYGRLELDPQDPNDIIAALKEINFSRFVVLEDFHYLPIETQQDFSYALKAFHENSKITFIVVAVWREENRLVLFNGDLTGRVVAIDADAWTPGQLIEVIEAGEALLNVQLDSYFKSELISASFQSVYLVQECCHRACIDDGAFETKDVPRAVGTKKAASAYIADVVNEQGGRYKSFLTNFALGFTTTELEMFKWILYPILTATPENLKRGIGYRDIREAIQNRHPRGLGLNPGNVTQALQSITGLQSKKNMKPFVLDYDNNNLLLSVVDTGFLIWLSSQDRNDLLSLVDLPILDSSLPLLD
ncbi:MAG: hypothetical protein JWL84_6089 [Rhodospirillales bacterium]|nr:hypothetical protein [Rhodospirillales bacterium]